MKTITIMTHDSVEIVNVETGTVNRSRNGEIYHEGSNDWIILGARVVNNFGNVVEYLDRDAFFDRLESNKNSLFYKNGKAKFRILDLDHGCLRQWSEVFKYNSIFTTK